MDALSDALQHIRLQGAWFLNGEFREPWCVDIPPPEQLAAMFLPGAERLAVCHVVVRGQCWARLPGQEPMPLHEGQVVVFPHGDAHLLGSGLRHAPVSLDHVIVPRVPELHRVSYGGSGAATEAMLAGARGAGGTGRAASAPPSTSCRAGCASTAMASTVATPASNQYRRLLRGPWR